jgi:hypothetical protein
MGVDLTLMPMLGRDGFAAHDLIRLERRRDLWTEIMALPAEPLTKPLNCLVARLPNGESGYGRLETDPYGERVHTVKAGDLAKLADNENVTDNWVNRAAWGYLAQMPPDWPVALYWH